MTKPDLGAISMDFDTAWLDEQVLQFSQEKTHYELYAEVLKRILLPVVTKICPTAISESRAKSIPSFARKCVKHYGKNKNPAEAFTDLCGARAIVLLQSQVDQLRLFVEKNFRIDADNSQDTFDRLTPEQFGYRSVHYIVKMDRGLLSALGMIPNIVTEEQLKIIGERKAEIQLRTVAQHVWADVGHDLLYKSSFGVPKVYRRESARIAAQIEIIDNLFTQIEQGMKRLETNAGSFLPGKAALDEVGRLQAVLKYAETDLSIIRRIVRLRISIGQYEEAVNDIEAFKGSPDVELTCDYGYALCRLHQDNHTDPDFIRGREALESALASAPGHVEALTRYAEVLGENEAAIRRELFADAYAAAPNNPLALCGYLISELSAGRTGIIPLLYPNIDQAMAICQEQIDVGVNLPYALYLLSTLHLLRDQPLQALLALARALSLSNAQRLTPEERAREKDRLQKEQRLREEVYDRLHKLKQLAQQHIRGLDWCLDLLRLSLSSPGNLHPAIQHERMQPHDAKRLAAAGKVFNAPIVIIAGGCDPDHEPRIATYTTLLADAFRDFTGTIISGGTQQGVSGLAGGLARPGLRAIGYLPHYLPPGATADDRYAPLFRMPKENDEIHPGKPFTPGQPLQTWKDLLGAGIDPATVKLIGIDGGEIAGFEYHLAAALGAQVAVVRQSGRVADSMMRFENEPGHENIHFIPEDTESLRALLEYPPQQAAFSSQQLVTLAAGVDEEYNRQVQLNKIAKWQDWLQKHPDRAKDFDRSNRMQAEHIIEKLNRIGKTAVPVGQGREPHLIEFSDYEAELLAEMEHGRWVIERTLDGWKFGPVSDNEKKLRPQLISWSELQEDERKKDRTAVRVIPRLLAKIGYEIIP